MAIERDQSIRREMIADRRDDLADERERIADAREQIAVDRDWAAEKREFVADDRQHEADERQDLADEREAVADDHDRHRPGADDRTASAARHAAEAARGAAGAARRDADRDRAAAPTAHPLAAEFLAMARALLNAETVDLAMVDVVEAAVRFVNGCDAASFATYVDDVFLTIASTGQLADDLDEVQHRTAEGPCVQAIRTLQLVISDDLSTDPRWPAFAAETAGTAQSAMSSPVADDGQASSPFGSLNNYGAAANAFDEEDADTAILLTAHLGVLLRLASVASEAKDRAAQLASAVESRDVIGQAKGILMEREKLTADQAFDVLRKASQRLNRKLRDVSDDVARSGAILPRPDR